ncbi:crossover junction endodeoxyribonuclease RuvC [Roseicyclus sp. F158]|uniref:Crossover junction endodeoxyribonuclease RuvC n=1 Tax=Tropicimonas omnivorans TaxID=3075590 RepID=A0ABU3DHV2_9RHOB|nr:MULTISPECIES: crossover junction endodeoxyribonuclease RuvC [Roseobacteraceae]MDT0683280.1 crossover junction endodeoxyribonuclease RuvC [Roseicyclus sp. F158]
MRVIGIDPGLTALGWGVIEQVGSRLVHVANGICRTQPGVPLAVRLCALHSGLTAALREHAPDAAAVEMTVVNRDGAGTLKLGQARGIAMLVPAQAGLDVGEYAPSAVKKAMVGTGRAAKAQIDHMVRLQFPGIELAGADAADALAIAVCHAHHLQTGGKLAAAMARA